MWYIDVYTVEDYKQRVSEITSKVGSLNEETEIVKREQTLMQQIEVLESKEQQIFNILGVSSVEQLNSRLQEFRAAVFNLSGPQLYEYFTKELSERNKSISANFSKDVQHIISQTLNEEGISYASLGKENVVGIVRKLLSENLGNTRIKVGKGFTSEAVFPSKFTKAQKKRWEELINKARTPEGIQYNGVKISLQPTTPYQLSGEFNWEYGTFGLTKSEAQQLYGSSPQVLQHINERMTDYILSHVSSHQEIVRDIIQNKILAKDPYAFFVGKNVNDITGLLGEIQGLYYLRMLTGKSNSVEWVGGIAQNGKKPHQDIILEDYFGIQVKNTTKDLLKNSLSGMNVGFQSATLDHFFNTLPVSSSFKEALEFYYGTKMFNVPYHVESSDGGNHYASGIGSSQSENTQSYLQSKTQLDSLADDVDMFLQGFAAIFMYLDVETEVLRLYDGNSLFLLGGAMFVTASEILTEVLGELRAKRRRLRIEASFSDSRNIIEALNDKSRATNYSGEVLKKIVLSTSYNF